MQKESTHNILVTDWPSHQATLAMIREQVFIREQGISIGDEWDDKDEIATHFLVYTEQGEAIACARLLTENVASQKVLHVGRVAVLKEYRKLGIGRYLMKQIVVHCQCKYPGLKIYLHAQTTRQIFYEHLGFVAAGTEFMDAGIPHIEMWLAPKTMPLFTPASEPK